MSFSHSPKTATTGLVLYLDAANLMSYKGTGLVWKDLTQNKNDVTASTTIGLTKFKGALGFNFDTTGKYFYSSTFKNSPATDATLEAWIYPAAAEVSAGDRGTIILNNGTSGLYMSWNKSTEKLSNYWYSHPTEGYHENAAASARSAWHHWVSVWNNSTGLLYQYTDGVKASTDASTVGNSPGGSSLNIGQESSDRQFAGGIAIIKIYNFPLSTTQVVQNFNALRGRFGI